MPEIKCPRCGTVLTVDENEYRGIVEQVRNEEFEKELKRREELLLKENELKLKLQVEKANTEKEDALSDLKVELEKAKSEKNELIYQHKLELSKAVNQKDSEINELKKREEYLQKEGQANLKLEVEKAVSDLKVELEKARTEKNELVNQQKLEISKALAEKDNQINELKKREEFLKKENETNLKFQVEKAVSDLKVELEKAKSEKNELANQQKLELSKAISEKDNEILGLKNNLELNNKQAELNIENLNKEHEIALKQKDELINFYKDMKAKLSTKMIGESLEQHCLTEFNKIRATAFPNAYFEKDNEVIEHGKGDFVFRDKTSDGIEFISIMFEMKNQNDDGDKKHKNEEFFKKLEEDRQKKGCEYAVLVSLLEPESELYNQGIVDVSYKYKNMYVIRPQFFIPMITLLRNAAIKNIDARRELTVYQQQNYDLVNFERNLREYKEDFSSNVMRAGKNFTDAINEIDKSIKELEKTKENLLKSAHQLSIADKKVQGITIKKLTKDAPSIQSAFDELNKDEN